MTAFRCTLNKCILFPHFHYSESINLNDNKINDFWNILKLFSDIELILLYNKIIMHFFKCVECFVFDRIYFYM